jgi:hypothetical protein
MKRWIRKKGFAVGIFIVMCILLGMTAAQEADSVQMADPITKRPWVAATEAFGLNMFIWSFDRYVMKADYAYIGWETMKANLKHGFEFDADHFPTNQFAHPYHGSLYFNSARANGMSFWESTPFVFGGSLMWELFMENEYPSANDLMTTTMGGIMLGETTFRLSELVLDDRARGGERVWREIGGFLLSPMHGFNRLIFGRTKHYDTKKNHIKEPVTAVLGFGGNSLSSKLDVAEGDRKMFAKFDFVYGKPLEERRERKPFDFLKLQSYLSFTPDSGFLNVTAYGALWGQRFHKTEKATHTLGMFQHFDFLTSKVIHIGGSSFTPGLVSRFSLTDRMRLFTSLHLGWLVWGGANSDHVPNEKRTYSMGTGILGKLETYLLHASWGRIYFAYYYHHIFNVDGAKGQERNHLTLLRYTIPVWKKWGVGFEYLTNFRNSIYNDYDNIKRYGDELRGFVSYSF